MNCFQLNKHPIGKLLFLFLLCCFSLISINILPQKTAAQVVEETLDKDELKVNENLPWGIKKWPYGKIIEVKDLAKSIYGRMVIDRYGIDESYAPVKQPFSRIKPGKLVIVSMWGSDLDGCYVETVIQVAPKNNINPEITLPTLIELAIGNEILELTPKLTNPQIITYRYNYLDGRNSQKRGLWHMNRRVFNLDSVQASKLINAPIEDVKARMHFGTVKTIPFKIGVDTVERWQDIYSFNSSCQYIP